jgi:hypothetical protein
MLSSSYSRLIADLARFEAIANNCNDLLLVEVKQRIAASADGSHVVRIARLLACGVIGCSPSAQAEDAI